MIVKTIDSETKSAKSLVIQILSEEKNLSIRQIFEKTNCSYSNLYKALDILITQGKIEKKDGRFSLNLDWVKELGRFSEKVQKIYSQKIAISLTSLKEDHEVKSLRFDNLAQADDCRKRLQIEYIRSKRKHPYIGIYNHLRSPIIDPELSLRILETLKENNTHAYLAIASNTKMDRWCARFYMRNPIVSIKTGLSLPSSESCETMILGNVIVQMTIPNEINDYIEKIYSFSRSIDDINPTDFYERVYKTKSEIKIVILKNKIVSEYMRNKVMNSIK